MLHHPAISPVIAQIGPFTIRWYGLMYVLTFLSAWILGKRRLRKNNALSQELFEAMLLYGMIGMILGGRLFYALFYNPGYYLAHPLKILATWEGGLSFHGGLVGVLLALGLLARKNAISFFQLTDFAAPLTPLGLFFGRIGNFINGELWGQVTSSPLGMVFPGAGPLPRHPSQLYEALGEGLGLFIALWIFSSSPRPLKAVSAVFALGYGCCRLFIEFFRQPDVQIGFISVDLGFLTIHFLTMGMLLTLPLIAVGCILLWQAYHPSLPASSR